MLNSFRYAFNGIKDAFKSEPNLRFHFFAAFVATSLALMFKFNYIEMTILIIAIFFVITLELINTTIEQLVDLHSKDISEEARAIKDISAAFVSLGAFASLIIGLILFLNKIF